MVSNQALTIILLIFLSRKWHLLTTYATHIQMHSRSIKFIMKANTMNPDREHSDLGPYCLQYTNRPPKYMSRRESRRHLSWIAGKGLKKDFVIDHMTSLDRWLHALLFVIVMYLYVYYRNLTCFNRWQLYISSNFNASQCNWSLTNHWPWASFPLINDSRGLHCHLSLVCWQGRYITMTTKHSFPYINVC